MNKTQIIYTVLFWVIIILFSYIIILQPKVKAGNEILEIQLELQKLDTLEQEAKDRWHIAEQSKSECIESWNKQQEKENKHAEDIRAKKEELNDRLGLILSRKAQ